MRYRYLPFMDVEIEAHRGLITVPKSHSYLMEEKGFKARPV